MVRAIRAVTAVAGSGQPEQDPQRRARVDRHGNHFPALVALLPGALDQRDGGQPLRQHEYQGETPQQKDAPRARKKIQPKRDQDDQGYGYVEFTDREDGSPGYFRGSPAMT